MKLKEVIKKVLKKRKLLSMWDERIIKDTFEVMKGGKSK